MFNLSKDVLSRIEDSALEKGLPIIGRGKGKVLEILISEFDIKKILEVGTNVGYSSILMASSFSSGCDDCRIFTMEIDFETSEIARKNVERVGLNKLIEVKHGDAKKIISNLSGGYELLFLDAVKSDYLEYLTISEPFLLPGAIVVADNVKIFERLMKNYLEYVRNGEKYKSITVDFGNDAIEISVYNPSQHAY